MTATYDLIVIGGGTAGYSAAVHAAEKEGRVLLVDAGPPGGRGLSLGPKGLLNAVMHPASPESLNDWNEIKTQGRDWVNGVVRERTARLQEAGVEVVQARGRVVSPAEVQILEDSGEPRSVEGKAVVVATGSRVKSIASMPFDGEWIQTSEDIWDWRELPQSVLIAGSQAESLEWAFVLRRLGVKVFLVHGESELLPELDPDLLETCEKTLKKEKVKILLNKKITSIYKNNEGLDVALDGGVRFTVNRLVVCGEREVDLEDSIAVAAVPDRGQQGEVLVDEKLKTTVAGIYAAGSVTGHLRCRYRSEEEGRVAAANALGKKRSLHSQLVPRVLQFPDEIASVGCNLEMAHHLGYRGIEGRGGGEGAESGSNNASFFVKLVFEKKSREIIGGQAVGPGAGDIIEAVRMGMRKGQGIRDFCHFQGDGEPFWGVLREAAEDGQRKVSELR